MPTDSIQRGGHSLRSGTWDLERRRRQSILKAALAPLPTRLRRAAARMIAPRGDYATVQILGHRAGVRDISVLGDFGLVQGSVADTAVLATYARTKTWRPAIAQFFNEFFHGRVHGAFIDIGANIGLSTIPIAKNSRVNCFDFEPDAENFRYLRNNVLENCRHKNVQLFELALFDRAGSLDFRRCDHNKGNHHLSRPGSAAGSDERESPVVRVSTARLDDVLAPYLADPATPIGAKIVAQGAEAQIVAGGHSILSRVGAMLIEIYPYGIERLQGDLESLLRFCSLHFSEGALNTGEDDELLTWVPVDDVAAQLRDRYEAATRDAAKYYHLFLKK